LVKSASWDTEIKRDNPFHSTRQSQVSYKDQGFKKKNQSSEDIKKLK
jgi:hypothetical protein